MTDDCDPLGDYLDIVILEKYGTWEEGRVQLRNGFGGIGKRYVELHPRHSEIVEYVEDEITGRPHPVDDSADHFLLRRFDDVRRDLSERSPPIGDGTNGQAARYDQGRVDTWYRNELYGEIPWRCLHSAPWPCIECGHAESLHGEHSTGWNYCDADDGRCNCGNNIGR